MASDVGLALLMNIISVRQFILALLNTHCFVLFFFLWQWCISSRSGFSNSLQSIVILASGRLFSNISFKDFGSASFITFYAANHLGITWPMSFSLRDCLKWGIAKQTWTTFSNPRSVRSTESQLPMKFIPIAVLIRQIHQIVHKWVIVVLEDFK